MTLATALLACAEVPTTPSATSWLPPVDRPVWASEEVDDLANAWRFQVLLPEPGPTAVTCTLASDPDEVHSLASSPADAADERRHDHVVYGLLAESTYDCVLSAGGEQESRRITTPPLPGWLPSWELTVPGDAGGAYTLMNHGTSVQGDRETKLLVVDADGRLRWYLKLPYSAPDLDAQYLGGGEILYGGGYSAPPTRIDLSGRTLREAWPPGRYHHHVERLDTGHVITLRVDQDEGGGDEWKGFVIDRLDPELQVADWTWDSQRGVDDGWLPFQTDPDDEDPDHANALVWFDDAVVVNLYELGWIAKIDRSSGQRLWTLGPGRDFTLLDAVGKPAPESEWFWHTHAPEFDGDRLLVYDNGRDRPGGEWSRALELELDEEARTARIVWEFREDGWYERIWGDVDRLPSGNVLVLRAHCSHCTDFTDQRTEVVEVDPSTNTVVWRMTFLDANDASYRAARIEGCEIFANSRYCP